MGMTERYLGNFVSKMVVQSLHLEATMLDTELAWRGMREANPWWETGAVPSRRTRPFRRAAFDEVYRTFRASDAGRGVVMLGPRRIGKTVLLHQIVQQCLADGVRPHRIVHLALDDVALRGADLGALLDLVATRLPEVGADEPRLLLLDEVQHTPEWSGWLKRIADRRDPYVFLATGSSATALRHGSQDAGLGRWRELVLYPWSFREHVRYRHRDRGLPDDLARLDDTAESIGALMKKVSAQVGRPASAVHSQFIPTHALGLAAETVDTLNRELIDYMVRGGFPEVLDEEDWREAQRHLRQDILDRSLGRDIADVERVDTRVLERMFLRVCKDPGGQWNGSTVASDLGISRPTVSRYLELLERAFLVFGFPNLASPIKGLSKVYLVAPSMRAALLGLDHDRMRDPREWGPVAENLVAASLFATRGSEVQVGFWRLGTKECDALAVWPGGPADAMSELIEVKTGVERNALQGIRAAAEWLDAPAWGAVLSRDGGPDTHELVGNTHVYRASVAAWLYEQRGAHGGTLRVGS